MTRARAFQRMRHAQCDCSPPLNNLPHIAFCRIKKYSTEFRTPLSTGRTYRGTPRPFFSKSMFPVVFMKIGERLGLLQSLKLSLFRGCFPSGVLGFSKSQFPAAYRKNRLMRWFRQKITPKLAKCAFGTLSLFRLGVFVKVPYNLFLLIRLFLAASRKVVTRMLAPPRNPMLL